MTPAEGLGHSWLSYWSASNKSYVNERHKQAHYAAVFAGVRPYLPKGPGRVALDWGCADAYRAREIAGVCGEAILYDAAGPTRERLHARFCGDQRIRVIDGGLDELADASVDIVIVNSVIQYLSSEELTALLGGVHRVLKPDGALVIGDVIDPDTPTARHVGAFLAFAARNGFLVPAILALACMRTSAYGQLHREIGLAAYRTSEIEQQLADCGFAGERLARNIAVSPYRSSYIARKLARANGPAML
jgi:ubiquinone/menaquinone biosynthesis C-methylase UbiE